MKSRNVVAGDCARKVGVKDRCALQNADKEQIAIGVIKIDLAANLTDTFADSMFRD